MQLVAYGSQDIYVTGHPQITFWKQLFNLLQILQYNLLKLHLMDLFLSKSIICIVPRV